MSLAGLELNLTPGGCFLEVSPAPGRLTQSLWLIRLYQQDVGQESSWHWSWLTCCCCCCVSVIESVNQPEERRLSGLKSDFEVLLFWNSCLRTTDTHFLFLFSFIGRRLQSVQQQKSGKNPWGKNMFTAWHTGRVYVNTFLFTFFKWCMRKGWWGRQRRKKQHVEPDVFTSFPVIWGFISAKRECFHRFYLFYVEFECCQVKSLS